MVSLEDGILRIAAGPLVAWVSPGGHPRADAERCDVGADRDHLITGFMAGLA
jgi:hypothetical protein